MGSKQVVVVGSRGFIGQNTVKKIDKLGHNVFGVVSEHRHKLSDRVFWKEIKPTHIVWLASRITPSIAQSSPEIVRQELDEFHRFLESIEGIPVQVVFASSGGTVYTDESLPFSESSKALAANEYGKSKLAMEQALTASGIDSTILRIANAYGPGQRLDRGQGVIGTWLTEIKAGNPITVFGSLENIRDFVFIDDVADSIVASINHANSSQIFNIGSGAGVSLQRLIDQIRTITEVDFSINHLEARSIDRRSIWLNIDKAHEILDWQPSISLKHGLKMTWESLFYDRTVE